LTLFIPDEVHAWVRVKVRMFTVTFKFGKLVDDWFVERMTLDVTVYRMSLVVCQKLTKDIRTFNYIKFEPLLLFYCVCKPIIDELTKS
jgi:hypothetical protein